MNVNVLVCQEYTHTRMQVNSMKVNLVAYDRKQLGIAA